MATSRSREELQGKQKDVGPFESGELYAACPGASILAA
jgi:hypothetical protein